MKNLFLFGMLILLSLTLMSSTCSSDDDDGSNNNVNITEIVNTMESGIWRITNFVDSGINETIDFDGYNFTFAANGTLTATNGSNTLTGSWSVTSDNNDVDFNINFPVSDSNVFEDLNDDWDIVTYTDTTIELEDVDDNVNDTDLLMFEKNE